MNVTEKDIEDQEAFVRQAEADLIGAKLRLRAMKGEALMQAGDSFPVAVIMQHMDSLGREFGLRNLRAM